MSKTLLPPSNELETSDLESRVARIERQLRETTSVWLVGDVKPTFEAIAGLTGEQEPQTNWLLLNGASVSTDKWPELFAKWGYQFGGSGSLFSLPDGRGRCLYGRATSGTLGTTGGLVGAETVTLTTTQIPSHAHQPTVPTNGFMHTSGGSAAGAAGGSFVTFIGQTNVGNTGFSGGGGSHNNLSPGLVISGWLVYAGLKQA